MLEFFNYNYWDDLTSPDTNNDDIIDTPYIVEGEIKDLTPKATPFDIKREEIVDSFLPNEFKIHRKEASEVTQVELSFPKTEVVAFSIVILTIIGGVSYYFYQGFVIKESVNKLNGGSVDSVIKLLFKTKSAGFMILGNKIINSDDLDEELMKSIPDNIVKYKFLMNPIRLSICKLLFDKMELSFSNLKNALGISYGDLGTHTKALSDKGYIKIYTKFSVGKQMQFTYMEPEGERRYKELVDLLNEFLDNSHLDSTFLDQSKDIIEKHD